MSTRHSALTRRDGVHHQAVRQAVDALRGRGLSHTDQRLERVGDGVAQLAAGALLKAGLVAEPERAEADHVPARLGLDHDKAQLADDGRGDWGQDGLSADLQQVMRSSTVAITRRTVAAWVRWLDMAGGCCLHKMQMHSGTGLCTLARLMFVVNTMSLNAMSPMRCLQRVSLFRILSDI